MFQALTDQDDAQGRWSVVTFPIDLDMTSFMPPSKAPALGSSLEERRPSAIGSIHFAAELVPDREAAEDPPTYRPSVRVNGSRVVKHR